MRAALLAIVAAACATLGQVSAARAKNAGDSSAPVVTAQATAAASQATAAAPHATADALETTAGTPPAAADTDEKTAARVQAANADEHATPAGSDPWLVSSSAALFTRPSVFSAFKLSNDTTTDKKSTYGVSASYKALQRPSKYLDGLQASAAYNVTDKILSVGFQWTIDLRDVRFLSAATIGPIATAGKNAFKQCDAEHPGLASKALLEACFSKQAQAEIDHYKHAVSWHPSFALAASTGYDFTRNQRDKSTVNVAAELGGILGGTTAALTLNAELDRIAPDMMATGYRTQVGAGLQASDKFAILDRPVTLAAGAKVLSCIGDACTGMESTLEVGGGLGVQIQKATQVGFNIKWAGVGAHLDDAIAGLALSYTFTK